MASSNVALCGLLMCLLAVIVCSEAQVPVFGGWQKRNVGDDAIYEELAHFAISKQVENRQFFDTVLELVDVETQTVAGTNYRIKFKITESTCPVTAVYSKTTCLPKSQETVKDVCTARIIDVPWTKERSLTSFTCEGSTVTS
ncbi:salivary cystatin-L2-like [Dermacentor silvarum]|uniref:salivary cystatin-L2-like n=1 Tax=Dermacentor silvarum TaxID=543639 RepID=UPI0018978671|nr:salivary cystatin-L2-like [Dermacentor silvarum]XP_049527179.1 salivary cystatin-L2-like [Dermacentor silvarum]